MSGGVWDWVKDRAYSFEVGAAGIADLTTGSKYNFTASVLSEAVPTQDQAETYERAKQAVTNGLLDKARTQTQEDIKAAIRDVGEAIPSFDVPWWVWATAGTIGAVALFASFGYALRSVRLPK